MKADPPQSPLFCNYFLTWAVGQLACILPRECIVKYTPRLEVILKELNLSIPSFRTRRGRPR